MFTLTGWATAAAPDWNLTAKAVGGTYFDPNPVLAQDTIGMGTTTLLTLTVPPGASSGTMGAAIVYSGAVTDNRYWPVVVQVQ
jgi:hypothetical protein